jgi:hypothetical protein
VTGRHSVMLRPDSVSRVRPPKTTIPKTLAAEPSSQYATLLLLTSGNDELWVVFFAYVLVGFVMVWLNAPSGEALALDGAAAEEL